MGIAVYYKAINTQFNGGKTIMLYADKWNKYKAKKVGKTICFYKLNWLEKILLQIMGYKVTRLPER